MKYLFAATAIFVSLVGGMPFSEASEIRVGGVDNDDEKVKIELYYESQCPGCRAMITGSFSEAFKVEGFLDMAEVVFIPYGNAHETTDDSGTSYDFQCQHGPSECVYNTIETCALAKIDDPLAAFQYIDCIENSDESRDPTQDYGKVAMACCEQTNLPAHTVSEMRECATGAEGIRLEHEAAVKTDSLDPPHTFVPYVVVNGTFDYGVQKEITASLFDYVCGSYEGPNKNTACPTKTANNNNAGTTSTAAASLRGFTPPLDENQFCYRGGDSPTTTATRA